MSRLAPAVLVLLLASPAARAAEAERGPAPEEPGAGWVVAGTTLTLAGLAGNVWFLQKATASNKGCEDAFSQCLAVSIGSSFVLLGGEALLVAWRWKQGAYDASRDVAAGASTRESSQVSTAGLVLVGGGLAVRLVGSLVLGVQRGKCLADQRTDSKDRDCNAPLRTGAWLDIGTTPVILLGAMMAAHGLGYRSELRREGLQVLLTPVPLPRGAGLMALATF
jgi:hypothetical protein